MNPQSPAGRPDLDYPQGGRPPFEERLASWLKDGPTRAPIGLLETVLSTIPQTPQRRGAWRIPWRISPMLGFARGLATITATIVLGAVALLFIIALRPAPGGVGGPGSPAVIVTASPASSATPAQTVIPTTSPVPSASSDVSATPTQTMIPTSSPTTSPAPSASPKPKPSGSPAVAACDPAQLVARVTIWTGGMGSRFADVKLTNSGPHPCTLHAMARPQLVDGHGTILIDGAAAGTSSSLTIKSGFSVSTQVAASNYCGATPKAPVTVAFILAGGGRVVASPTSPTDTSGVPPCNGPSQAAQVSMHPFAP